MTMFSLGKITVTTAGTPVRVTAAPTNACLVRFQVIDGETSKMYVGLAGMNVSTLAGCLDMLMPGNTAGNKDEFVLENPDGTNAIKVDQFWIDAAANGAGLLVTYGVR